MKRPFNLIGFIFLFQFAGAQQSFFITDPEVEFKEAREQFEREAYSLAYPKFKELDSRLQESDRSDRSSYYQQVRFYLLVCRLKQGEKGAEVPARDFITGTHNLALTGPMRFHLAEYYFQSGDFSNARELYAEVSVENLNNKEVTAFKFHQGYCFFQDKKYASAKPLFNAVRQLKNNPFYPEANYYFGFIAFSEAHYAEALAAFRVVEEDPYYRNWVPYHIAVIYYMQGERQKAFDYAEKQLKKSDLAYEPELQQLVGHGYYVQEQFDKALPYLENYVRKQPSPSREDIYELAYCHYRSGNWDKAISGFKQLSSNGDSLSRQAMYLLGDAFLKTGQRASARNAFLFCSSNSTNTQQREVSMFNYAKLSYELGYQDVAQTELQKFISLYPQSSYISEARELMVNVLAQTSNYKDALALMESLPNPSAATRKVLPKVLYGRAVELINDGMLVSADELLSRAEVHPQHQEVLPLVLFWKGELAYRLSHIDDAIRYLLDYLNTKVSSGDAQPIHARYDLGYCFLKKENYMQARSFFEQVASSARLGSSPMEQDAWMRTADCYFMARDFRRAKSMYQKALDFSWPAADYATYQLAMVAGVNSSKEKITLLLSIPRKFPKSNLIQDANMEIAGSYLADEQYQEALPYLKQVVNDPALALKPKAYLRMGIAYYNLNNNEEALKQYAFLLQQFPNSPEAEEALDNAKVIYVEEGKSAAYVDFARGMGKEITVSQEEQLAYQEAEFQFNNGNFINAAKKFEEYLDRFPEGKHSLDALYYKSEIYFNQKEFVKAAGGYETLSGRVPNKFGEKALLQAARIYFFEVKDYEKAETFFVKLKAYATTQENRLEAMRGLLRSQFQLKHWSDATENAKELLNEKGIGADDRILANLALARSFQLNGSCPEAITYYRNVVALSKAAYGAEAQYEIASCHFALGRYADAEKAAFEVINKSGSYEDWVVKAYLLLGDTYVKQGDLFNAKATYQSIIDNAKVEPLRQEAEKRLAALKEGEANPKN